MLTVHAALLALVLMASRAVVSPALPDNSVQLLSLVPEHPERIKIAHISVQPLNGPASITIGPPVSDASSLPMSANSGGSSSGDGSDVDWGAEARRALRAFNIRSHLASNHKSVSARPEDESWLPSGPHRSGEPFKTPSGDWIVWINANCYQIASSASSATTTDTGQSQILCRQDSKVTR